jgi:uncharacterized membrane protein YqjE
MATSESPMAVRQPGEIAEPQSEESTASLLRGALLDVGEIVRAEMALAKVEVREDAKRLGRTLPMGTAGGVLGLFGVVFLLHAIALALDLVLPGWAAYLITAAVTITGGAALMWIAFGRLKDWKSFVPERTLESLEENKRWMQRKLS